MNLLNKYRHIFDDASPIDNSSVQNGGGETLTRNQMMCLRTEHKIIVIRQGIPDILSTLE